MLSKQHMEEVNIKIFLALCFPNLCKPTSSPKITESSKFLSKLP